MGWGGGEKDEQGAGSKRAERERPLLFRNVALFFRSLHPSTPPSTWHLVAELEPELGRLVPRALHQAAAVAVEARDQHADGGGDGVDVGDAGGVDQAVGYLALQSQGEEGRQGTGHGKTAWYECTAHSACHFALVLLPAGQRHSSTQRHFLARAAAHPLPTPSTTPCLPTWVTKTTESAPRRPMLVSPADLTALKAYSAAMGSTSGAQTHRRVSRSGGGGRV